MWGFGELRRKRTAASVTAVPQQQPEVRRPATGVVIDLRTKKNRDIEEISA